MTPRAFVRLKQLNGGQALVDVEDIAGVSQGGEGVTLVDRRDGHTTLLVASSPGEIIDSMRHAISVAQTTQRSVLHDYVTDEPD